MNYVHATDSAIKYPYSLWDLRRDNPNVSFSAEPTAEDLAPFGVFAVVNTSPPACHPRNERVIESDPICHENGEWRQAWKIRMATEEEMADYDIANAPGPDWGKFKAFAMNSDTLNRILAAAVRTAPAAASALAPELIECTKGQFQDFSAAWATICRAENVQSDVTDSFAKLARRCHLPDEFCRILEQAGQIT